MKKTLKPVIALFFIFTCMLFAKTPVNADTTHTVIQGDTLGRISKQYYGDSSRWKEIFENNSEIIKNPNMLSIGWALKIQEEKQVTKETTVSRGLTSSKDILFNVRATAYDLSVTSCGKRPTHPQYGLTRSGRQIGGLTRTQAACVAVDPKVIPLGSLLYITFEDPDYSKYDGGYQALDTGGAVRGRRVDIFLGDFNSSKETAEVLDFGVTNVKIVILRRGW